MPACGPGEEHMTTSPHPFPCPLPPPSSPPGGVVSELLLAYSRVGASLMIGYLNIKPELSSQKTTHVC